MADEQQKHYLPGNNRRGGAGRSSSFHGGTSAKDGDFDVWDSNSLHETSYHHSTSSNLLQGSSGSGPKPPQVCRSSSAPMAIPDWHKIYGAAPTKGAGYKLNQDQQQRHDSGFSSHASQNYYSGEEEEGEMIPPHEYIARKLASSRISSFSVCEGAGRTLKGRDLSRVRNAILTKTGFLE